MSRTPLYADIGRRMYRGMGAVALTVALGLLPVACNDSKKQVIDRASLTRAAASLALSVGELVERYCAQLPTGAWTEDLERMRSIFKEEVAGPGFATVGRSFSAAASASRDGGSGKAEAARQLIQAAWLASEAFRPPQTDYQPGDEAMLVALASRLEPQLDVALTSTYDFVTGGRTFPASLDAILADAVSFVMLVAGYNYAGRDGSHPMRERMRAVGMDDPPAAFLDPAGNLRLPHGSEPSEQISPFEWWRTSSVDGTRNRLWTVVASAPDHQALWQVFESATETALE